MDGRLHSHRFNELVEGLNNKGKVIVDIKHKYLFSMSEVYDENHIIVSLDEFKKNNGIVRSVAIRK